jgi:spermidine synthase
MFLAVWVLLFSLRNPAAAHHATLDIDTNYHRVLIRDVVKDEVPLRMMITDPMGAQSIMNLNDPSALHSKYVRAVGDIIRNVEPKQSVLVLGGGAYSIPKFIENQFPDSSVTVVEIDEQLTEIAKKHFSFVPSSKLKIEHRDARMFLASPSLEAPQSRQKFDLIIFDVYSSSPSIPFHLVTLETFTAISAMLTQEGVIGLNVVSSVEGPASRFLRSISATIAEVFPHIDLLKVNPKLAADRVQNVLIVASSSEDSLKSAVRGLEGMSLKPEFKFPSDGTSIYRDDFAPVEWDMLAMFNNKLRLRKKEEQ